ncbi:UDP-glucose:glycoprotein glucosyltransferase 1-like [Saccostrea cucullata]|uniref:UDP-glucose:glycoprotein glucosyltransferase 1-like n=1 Tax=Saccostrea cuccullata TaxID=36930 RepID=UPI002ED0465D
MCPAFREAFLELHFVKTNEILPHHKRNYNMAASINMWWLYLWTLITLVFAKQKPVTVSLDAKWSSTPLLLEASEYIAGESNEKFWEFVDSISALTPEQVQSDTAESNYHLIQKYAGKVLSPLHIRLMKFSLSLRSFSPAIENFQQMSKEEPAPEDCDMFVSINGEKICDVSNIDDVIKTAANKPKSSIYKFDHVYPGTGNKNVVAVLYGELGMPGFTEIHQKLKSLSKKNEVSYVLRHFVKNPSEEKTRLSGYGVELAIKSTEYKAKDDTKIEGEGTSTEEEDQLDDVVQGFDFAKLKELYPEQKADLKKLRNHLVASSSELAALKVWELQDLSYQTAQKVLSADRDDQIKVLQDLSQNFPSKTRSLSKVAVKSEVKNEISQNRKNFDDLNIGTGESAMFLNGIPVEMEVYDIYTLLDLMKSEARIMEGLFSMGFKGDELEKFMRLDLGGDSKEFALDIRHTAIQFLNDLENDKKYKNWPSSVQDILRPTFPGMLRHVAKNFFHLVFFVDPTRQTDIELIKMAEAFLVHSAPIRLSVVFVVNFDLEADPHEDASIAISRAFDYIRQEHDFPKALSFVTDIYEKAKGEEITAKLVIKEFKKKYADADMKEVFDKDSDEYDILRRAAKDYVEKSGLGNFPQVLLNGNPLKKSFLTEDTFEEGVVSQIMTQTPDIQKAVYQGNLHDYMNILEYLMEKEHVLPRLNSRVLSPPKKSLDFTTTVDDTLSLDSLYQKSSGEITAVMARDMKYLTRKDEESLFPVTVWVVCDLETPKGRELLYSAIKQLKHSYDMRLGLVFNHDSVLSSDLSISKAVYTALQTLGNNHAKSLITKLIKEENVADLKSGVKKIQDLEVHGMDMDAYMKALEKQTTDFLNHHGIFVRTVLGWGESDRGLIANGKVCGPLDEAESFTSEDVDLLTKVENQNVARSIKTQMMLMKIDGNRGSELIMKISSLLSSKTSNTERKDLSGLRDQHSAVKLPANPDSPAYQIEAVLDPVSQEAQKITPMIKVLREVANVDVKIYMNCRDKISEMPVKTYYRYVLEPDLVFKPDGSLTSGPVAKFTDLPQKSILTMGVNPPESWLVESVRAAHDLDNLLLEEVESGVTAEFALEYILIEGHCSDTTSGQPPRGLQFTLGTNASNPLVDTIVMANLGYFQLKANPGVWFLQLREGRSKDIYNIVGHEMTDTPVGSDDVVVAINSFKSKIIRVKVEKKKDKIMEQLLKDEDDDKSIWDSISSSFKPKEETEGKVLNIFSLASGHMYERLMRIMMLSVLKHTKSQVKFWFLKNYLSPSFKDFIPKMAKEYGFEYELVQYKWPRWLNQQKEKQRVMWGYKILFLDVLFPLDVKKIIFVDADQVVRTDLQELNDLDLEGAPYGYTPFCSSRREMDGFRFWRSGYWASHLAGREYHISALYVVDLKKFRRIAAGDRLRGQYQGLSQDPNSLSNLDQDLPNNMIHQVAIKSLPQDWLWCETWCSDESKKTAKTIDLCNNPQTKEPKLKAALRILPEWKEYDYEIKVLWDKVYKTNTRKQVEYEPPNIDEKKIGSKLHLHDEL